MEKENFNQKRYEQIWNSNELTEFEKSCNNEFLDLIDSKNMFIKSEVGKFKIYQN